TAVPFHFDQFGSRRPAAEVPLLVADAVDGSTRATADGSAAKSAAPATITRPSAPGCLPIGEVRFRQHVRVEGKVRSMRVQPRVEVPTLECVLVDDSGAISIIFLGRRAIAGIDVGVRVRVEGTAGESRGRLALLNPVYELVGRENGTMSHG